jgi:hypothetical protein
VLRAACNAPRHQFGDAQGRERRDLGRLHQHGITGGKGGAHVPADEHQRKIPRDDLTDDANRGALHVVEEAGLPCTTLFTRTKASTFAGST